MATIVKLTHGGDGAEFDVSDLVNHIAGSGRAYIIQGQNICTLDDHPKPNSLDVWLRLNFTNRRDTKQADNEVVRQLVSTGLFETGKFLCPDSERMCKGIGFSTAAGKSTYREIGARTK